MNDEAKNHVVRCHRSLADYQDYLSTQGAAITMGVMSQLPQRLMHWSCSKCGAKWDTKLDRDKMGQFNNGYQTTFCDDCLNDMGKREQPKTGVAPLGLMENKR